MLICKHKDGGWYAAHYKGKFKIPETGEWIDVVYYQRIPVLLKPKEDVNVLYARTVDNFRQNFTYYELKAFKAEIGVQVADPVWVAFREPYKVQMVDIYGQDD